VAYSAAFLSVGFGRLMRFLYRGLPSRPRFPRAFGPIVKPEIFTDKHMPPSATKFQVEVLRADLVVSTERFCAVYYKPSDQSQLVLRSDHTLIARAWRVANDKARELGWIQ
jgi:hypothetical protein